MTKTICHETIIEGSFPVTLIQNGIDAFTVVYGMQTKANLTYDQAALEYGACIMHALVCEGKLDNSEEEEILDDDGKPLMF